MCGATGAVKATQYGWKPLGFIGNHNKPRKTGGVLATRVFWGCMGCLGWCILGHTRDHVPNSVPTGALPSVFCAPCIHDSQMMWGGGLALHCCADVCSRLVTSTPNASVQAARRVGGVYPFVERGFKACMSCAYKVALSVEDSRFGNSVLLVKPRKSKQPREHQKYHSQPPEQDYYSHQEVTDTVWSVRRCG